MKVNCKDVSISDNNTYENPLVCQPLNCTLNLWLWQYWKIIFVLSEDKLGQAEPHQSPNNGWKERYK